MRQVCVRSAAAIAVCGMLVTAASAFAATKLVGGARYTGKSAACAGPASATTCTFHFRASKNGGSMRFFGKPVVDVWGCSGGGGEALLGGKLKGLKPTPIPVVNVRSKGSLFGSLRYTFKPTSAPLEHFKVTVTGHLANAGRKAVIVFHNTYLSSHGNSTCSTPTVTLTAH